MLKSILGGLAVLLLGGLLFFVDGDALARERALEDGAAESRTAQMFVHSDKNRYSRHDKYDLRASFVDAETGRRLDRHFVAAGMEGAEGFELREHDRQEVTVYLYDGEVIAVRLDDGDLVKGDDVGWRGFLMHWGLAVLVLGLVLLGAGVFFEVAGTGTVGMAMTLLGGVTFAFMEFPWLGYVAGALVLAGAGVVAWAQLTREKPDAEDRGEKPRKKARAKRG